MLLFVQPRLSCLTFACPTNFGPKELSDQPVCVPISCNTPLTNGSKSFLMHLRLEPNPSLARSRLRTFLPIVFPHTSWLIKEICFCKRGQTA
ncbi:hypothetical protein CDAR_394691 [Caerostris darwini]|uniref:Secreted protein n=1 Tax=Caerostris darwini TaxID=1538125 RepID=A0AAV4PEG1_9ARAC|nr:hypothetical protein CDAR_394691 [Caerostris darwini]